MTNKFRATAKLALLLPFIPIHAQAADCDRNFTTAGSILTGKRYTTVAELPNVTADSAYQSSYQSIAKQGFIIQQSDSSARVITAVDSNSAPGRPAPLNVTVESAQNGATITLTFGTPAGAFAPEGSVKDEFCKIVRAAATPQQELARSVAAEPLQRSDDRANAIGRTNAGAGRVCLANACIGMSLEEAAKLNLKSVSTTSSAQSNFPHIGNRFGYYGLDAKGKLIAINNSSSIDRAWIRQFLQTMHIMCIPPEQLGAEVSASDGTPIQLGFNLKEQNGKVGYVLFSVRRMLPNNMSASEQSKFVDEVRNRYGRAFIESNDIGRTIKASNGEIDEGVAMVFPSFVELRGPGTPRGLGAKLMEQPNCSSRIQLD
jgi:hypothetical protein